MALIQVQISDKDKAKLVRIAKKRDTSMTKIILAKVGEVIAEDEGSRDKKPETAETV